MRRFPVLLVAFAMCGCTIFGRKKTASGWVVLDKAESAKCAGWPLREKDLAINDVAVVDGPKRGFLASGVKRDGSPSFVFVPFDGDVALEKDEVRDLPFGRTAVLAGGAELGGDTVAAVVQNGKTGAALELRTVKDNIVRFKGPLVPGEVDSGSLALAKGGVWMTFKKEDGGYGVAWVGLQGKGKASLKTVADVALPDAPVVVGQASGTDAVAFYKEGDSAKPFHARKVAADGTSQQPVALDVGVTSQVESWTATTHLGTHYVAVVDGDSLIGQAALRVAAIGWGETGPSVKWTKDAPLKDVHVTEPVFVATSKGLQVLLLKWVDEESTIGRYIVAGGTLGQPTFSGIFPKGARIVDAFASKDGDDLYVVVRHRDDTRWAFQICRI